MWEMIEAVATAAASVIKHIVELHEGGEKEQAKIVVDRFVALTKTQLDNDRETAEEILRRRFPQPDER